MCVCVCALQWAADQSRLLFWLQGEHPGKWMYATATGQNAVSGGGLIPEVISLISTHVGCCILRILYYTVQPPDPCVLWYVLYSILVKYIKITESCQKLTAPDVMTCNDSRDKELHTA